MLKQIQIAKYIQEYLPSVKLLNYRLLGYEFVFAIIVYYVSTYIFLQIWLPFKCPV